MISVLFKELEHKVEKLKDKKAGGPEGKDQNQNQNQIRIKSMDPSILSFYSLSFISEE